jgi:hypothetical protein
MKGTAATFAALVLCAAPGVRAQGRAGGDLASEEASKRLSEGLTHAASGEYDQALLSFQMAYALRHTSRILFNIALCEERLGRTLDALGHYKQIAAEQAVAERERDDAHAHVVQLLPKVASIDVQAPAGTRITLDEALDPLVAPLAEPLNALPGHHVVHLRFNDTTQDVPVDAAIGSLVHVAFSANDASGGAPSALDDLASKTPEGTPALTPEAVHEKPKTASTSVARNATAIAIGGAALVSVGLAIYFGVVARSNEDLAGRDRASIPNYGCSPMYLAKNYATCAQLQGAIDAQYRDYNWSTGLYITGGALAAGALVTWLVWPRQHPATGWFAPTVAPGAVALTAGGRF